jgi:hypothetical protein
MESGPRRIAVLLAALKDAERVSRMLRNAPLLRRGALLIRGPWLQQEA